MHALLVHVVCLDRRGDGQNRVPRDFDVRDLV
jgi:hypothetical protein